MRRHEGQAFEPKIYALLIRLREQGGAIVRESDCSGLEVANAIREDRHTSDSDGHGYVLLREWR